MIWSCNCLGKSTVLIHFQIKHDRVMNCGREKKYFWSHVCVKKKIHADKVFYVKRTSQFFSSHFGNTSVCLTFRFTRCRIKECERKEKIMQNNFLKKANKQAISCHYKHTSSENLIFRNCLYRERDCKLINNWDRSRS